MSELTTNAPAAAHAAPPAVITGTKAKRERKVSKVIREAIELLETGACTTQKAACERVGISEQHLSRSLKEVHVQAFIARRRAQNIAMGSLRASRRYVQLIDAESEHVAAKVSERILETTGDLKTSGGSSVSVNIQNNMSAGYVIDLTPWQGMAITGRQHGTDAKPLIDNDINQSVGPIGNGTDHDR